VTYQATDELLRDADQFARGGFLVKVSVPEGLELYLPCTLEIRSPVGQVEVTGQVVQMFPGTGIAVAFAAAQVEALVDAAHRAPSAGAAAMHEIIGDESKSSEEPAATPSPDADGESRADKIHRARYGNKDERMRIIRSHERYLHRFVVQNPTLGLDEVVAIAKSATVGPDILKFIADRREWAQRPEVAIALVRNAKTPIPIAIQSLRYIKNSELRQIAKTESVRRPIVSAARKMVMR